MRSLPFFFRDIPDPRRAQGRRHSLSTVLAIATAATLCGMRGYLAISDWAQSLGQKAPERFDCRRENGRTLVLSLSIIRDVLIRVDPSHLDRALQRWNQACGKEDQGLAIDGKTMRNAIDEEGHSSDAHHECRRTSKQGLLYPKKVGTLKGGDEKGKRTNYVRLERKAHYHFTVKGNQRRLFHDIKLYFKDRQKPDFIAYDPPDHGRIVTL
jgi:hypothetical protein